jgi:hypothetical protein
MKDRIKLFNFNHIDKKLNEDDVIMLKKLYTYYHEKWYCYKLGYKRFRMINTTLNIASMGLTATGAIVGSITLNPIILGCLTGAGVLIQGVIRMRKYDQKIEMTRFACSSYQKVLNKLRAYLRGEGFVVHDLVLELQLLDDQVTDLCPLVTKFKVKYDKKFTT